MKRRASAGGGMLATVLFTDIVGSTESVRASRTDVGATSWRDISYSFEDG